MGRGMGWDGWDGMDGWMDGWVDGQMCDCVYGWMMWHSKVRSQVRS